MTPSLHQKSWWQSSLAMIRRLKHHSSKENENNTHLAATAAYFGFLAGS